MAAISIPENIDPAHRLRNLVQLGSNVVVESDVPARRYLRSALEMEKMVKMCIGEFLYAVELNAFCTLRLMDGFVNFCTTIVISSPALLYLSAIMVLYSD